MEYCFIEKIITGNEGDRYSLRLLDANDASALGRFFLSLSPGTRSRFAPHPLDAAFAEKLCTRLDDDSAERFILLSGSRMIGYFILEKNIPEHESARYRNYSIELQPGLDLLFAPCLADGYQGKGLASSVMEVLLDHCRQRNIRSLVLLGGTQETNPLARHFYDKFGFNSCGGYQTDVWNIDMRLELVNSPIKDITSI